MSGLTSLTLTTCGADVRQPGLKPIFPLNVTRQDQPTEVS